MGRERLIIDTNFPTCSKNLFYKNASIPSDNGCMKWVGVKDKNGYGRFKSKQKIVLAHRFSYQLYHGEIPEGMFVCHQCDNPPCVAPNHLFIGSNKDNMQDMIKKGRKNAAKGIKHHTAILSPAEAWQIRNLLEYGYKAPTIAKMFKVSQGCIYGIQYNKNWKGEQND